MGVLSLLIGGAGAVKFAVSPGSGEGFSADLPPAVVDFAKLDYDTLAS